ncbi:PRC-barrel domain containing protein [Dactylosporangium matsuzakiense]|uniref:PRC-barrel domain containing protein n=1 Tax=Dactylosporangium matsuzakiense TaxID=53360 RepID=A0A9W6NJF4_9ACTN|nr:PRC-barrel domain containing protein [Dactylosporangium matsuzakiense]UWZ42224.1 PRC-barrel domain containing protein [Dactylosporangium matsuzakiense]GLK99874.1 hypothetical protein GCM10017581_016150 [Dactylosporangium matsuzakiense]
MFTDPYQVWQWRTGTDTAVATGTRDLGGFRVEAADRFVGTVDDSSSVLGTTCLVVDNDPWIPGRKMILPAGTVDDVDCAGRTVHLDRTSDQIRESPDYDPTTFARPHYYDQVAHYFAGTYRR